MRTPPLLADFIHPRGCKLKCEKFLTRPTHEISFHQIKLGFSKLVLVKKGDQQDECTPIWNIKILEMPLAKNLL